MTPILFAVVDAVLEHAAFNTWLTGATEADAYANVGWWRSCWTL